MSIIRADSIKNRAGNGAPDFPNGLTVTGIITSTTLSANITGDLTVTGNVGVGGTITYEDVSNVDSVGIITARAGINVSGGTGIFAGNINANGNIVGDNSTNISGINAITATTVSDSKGNLRSIPKQTNSGSHTLAATTAGKVLYTDAATTVPNSVFSAGDAVTIINNSGSNQTITQGSGLTLYNAADGATGNRTLAARGMATIWFADASTAYISGAGLS